MYVYYCWQVSLQTAGQPSTALLQPFYSPSTAHDIPGQLYCSFTAVGEYSNSGTAQTAHTALIARTAQTAGIARTA